MENKSQIKVEISLLIHNDKLVDFIQEWPEIKDKLTESANIDSARIYIPNDIKEIDLATI